MKCLNYEKKIKQTKERGKTPVAVFPKIVCGFKEFTWVDSGYFFA